MIWTQKERSWWTVRQPFWCVVEENKSQSTPISNQNGLYRAQENRITWAEQIEREFSSKGILHRLTEYTVSEIAGSRRTRLYEGEYFGVRDRAGYHNQGIHSCIPSNWPILPATQDDVTLKSRVCRLLVVSIVHPRDRMAWAGADQDNMFELYWCLFLIRFHFLPYISGWLLIWSSHPVPPVWYIFGLSSQLSGGITFLRTFLIHEPSFRL